MDVGVHDCIYKATSTVLSLTQGGYSPPPHYLASITHVGSREKVQDDIRDLAEAGVNTHIIACVVPEAYEATAEAFSAANFKF